MSDTEGDWVYIGESRVGDEGNNRIGIPDGVFEAEILSHPEETDKEIRVYWAYETVVGFLILSNRELTEKPDYKPQGSAILGGAKDNFRTTIPGEFFEDYGGPGGPVPEHARVQYGETRYFLYRTRMVEGETRSCFLLTKEQLENTISAPEEWAGSFDSIPRFMREQ